jgi:hypothetical protein
MASWREDSTIRVRNVDSGHLKEGIAGGDVVWSSNKWPKYPDICLWGQDSTYDVSQPGPCADTEEFAHHKE